MKQSCFTCEQARRIQPEIFDGAEWLCFLDRQTKPNAESYACPKWKWFGYQKGCK